MRYSILGPTEARDADGDPIALGPRLRALLAALALRADRGQPVSVDLLITEIWPEGDEPADAPAALQALVGRLRRAIGRDAVDSSPGGYRLAADPDDIDLHRFERLAAEGAHALDRGTPESAAGLLREALGLWRGEAVADLPDRESLAARPNATRLTALHGRIDADLALGRGAELVPELREAVAEQPLDERFHAQLIRALRAAGRPADALAAYEDARSTLAERLGADPGPELRTLHGELLTGAPEPSPAAAPPGNLRTRLTSFVGRDSDLATLRADLAAHRLVTLTGPGGSGKTRLSEEAAAAADSYPDGVWLAELAPLDHAAAVPGAVLSALGRRETTVLTTGLEARAGLRDEGAPDDLARLVEHCAHRRLLLVLDNCEHVIDAAATLAETLLARCPDVTILATSREPLGVPGESVRPVEPLRPAFAHRLFAERAAAVRPGFDPHEDPEAVAEICRRLDGLPLAIELAAARLRLLTPREIADRLDDRFRLLTSGSRTVLPRQQTLRAVVDWSWDLLDDGERGVLADVGVFAGGWTLEAAEAVCEGGSGQVLDLLAALVDKSLVVADPSPAGGMRYRLLETIHEYADERAAEHPDRRAATRARHTAHYLTFAHGAEPRLRGPAQLQWFPLVEAEADNFRAVLQRSLDAGDEDTLIALISDLGWFWWLRDYREEGVQWIKQVTDRWPLPDTDEDPRFWDRIEPRMLAFFLRAERVSAVELKRPEVLALANRCRAAYERPGPHGARFPGVLWPFTGYYTEGPQKVLSYMDEAIANCRTYGDDWALAVLLMFRMHSLIDVPGGTPRAHAGWDELEEVARRVGDRWILAQLAGARGELATNSARTADAHAAYEEAIALCQELDARTELPFLRARLAEVGYRTGDLDEAERLITAAREEAERYSVPDAAVYAEALQGYVELARGRPERARTSLAAARQGSLQGTPPPFFGIMLDSIGARIAAAEGDPVTGLREQTAALRSAYEQQCTEWLQAVLAEAAAPMLVALGEHAAAARVAGAVAAWHPEVPRAAADRRDLEAAERACRDALGDTDHERERAAGARLSVTDVIALLEKTTPERLSDS
ncbi:AfsR/SARP family transcriptional regulator [Streptomyces sp. A7024]|uniref:AfsR/SARP family transcriptional regulator n=1 Tax=Streptomyces coryli TaxID=1128680 RepID=A0A6G4U8I3_9ACTN|nr:AfsR/SARP family transcriptional regulator [Streptomyces coryli]